MSPLVNAVPAIKKDDYIYDAVTDSTELMWRCGKCGELIHRKTGLPESCPSCGASQREFALVEED